jgi:hypothetical protein
MNYYLEPSGFLGTGASLATDLTLIAYLLLIIPGMLAGFYFARSGRHRPDHKWTMILITIVNFVLIIGLMMFAYRYDVADNISSQPDNFRYLMPTIHALFGFPAQILAFIIIVNMLMEDRNVAAAKKRGETELSKYWWKWAKPVMRLTLVLWLVTSVFGVMSYLIRYDVLSLPSSADSIEPVATEEPEPMETEEPMMTEEPEPIETEEVEPTATEEPEPVETEEIGPTAPAPTATDEPEPVMTEEPEPVETEEIEPTEPVPTATDEPEPAMTEEPDPATTEEAGS